MSVKMEGHINNDMSGEITNNILEYILGGKSSFCVFQDPVGSNKGGKVWYSVTQQGKSPYFVHTDGKYLGFFFKDDLGKLTNLRVSSKKPEADAILAKPLITVMNSLYNKGSLPGQGIVHIISDGKCAVCGRRLKDFDSINYGIGPTCRKKAGI